MPGGSRLAESPCGPRLCCGPGPRGMEASSVPAGLDGQGEEEGSEVTRAARTPVVDGESAGCRACVRPPCSAGATDRFCPSSTEEVGECTDESFGLVLGDQGGRVGNLDQLALWVELCQ